MMPLTLASEYLYFLMVAIVWGWPVVGVALWLAWRRRRLAAGIKAVVLIIPVVALVAQLMLRSSVQLMDFRLGQEQDKISAYLGDPSRGDVMIGAFVGMISSDELEFRRYQFPSIDGSAEHVLEVRLPPDDVYALGAIELVRKNDAAQHAPARLIVWPAEISLNPAMAPDEFFRRYHPTEQPDAFGPHTLIVALRPRQSIIVHPRLDDTRSEWDWTDASLDLSGLRSGIEGTD